MSVKADRWIRRMAEQHGMIEPFEPGQVREHDGERVISYGTSSYGYDVRCADEFKIFTNINSSVVDPKNFDSGSFVNLQNSVCIIPPNSFALARTVEYFRIPRSVLTICMGKSTYARCFSADTRVALVDGTSATLEEMAVRHQRGEQFWGYSVDPCGRIIVTLLDRPRFIGRDSLLDIELDNEESVRCTPDHRFLMRDGTLRTAGELRPGDSLMPLYRSISRGYQTVYQPLDGHLDLTYRLSDDWGIRNGIYPAETNTHRYQFDKHRLLGRDRSVFRRLPELIKSFRGGNEQPADNLLRNHKVTRIKPQAGDHDVYCLTVPEAGNFALEAGIFVKNCGIIVNVTPLEPEWEGHVTLEFSNTTPLPAKIYANEGVAQMLFFESDEECETSYKDRGGKYQGQTGVTLPKT